MPYIPCEGMELSGQGYNDFVSVVLVRESGLSGLFCYPSVIRNSNMIDELFENLDILTRINHAIF